VSDYREISIAVCRDDADPQKIGTADVLILGVELDVQKKYID
jgi:hypothetical protein